MEYAVNLVREGSKKNEFKGAVYNRQIKECDEKLKRAELNNNDKIE